LASAAYRKLKLQLIGKASLSATECGKAANRAALKETASDQEQPQMKQS
jgi:hypothetical protein